MLGEHGLLGVVAALSQEEPGTVTPAILEKLRALYPGNLDEDDVTVLLFRATGAAGQRRFFTRAVAPLRVLGASVKALATRKGPLPLPEFSAINLLGSLFDGVNRRWRGGRDS